MTTWDTHALEDRNSRFEMRRRLVVRWVWFIYILMLIEGPLRKWFLPSLTGPLTLLRDPFVIALYAYALANGMMWRRGIAGIWLGFAALTSWVALLQYSASGFGLTGWMLGVRTYWLYMPLAFVVARGFTIDDVHRFIRFNLILAIPYAMLVATQYNSGVGAFVNRGAGGDEEGAVGLSDGILRPFGLFTYTGPNVDFTGMIFALFAAALLGSKTARPSRTLFIAAALAIASMSVLTGSRSIYFTIAIILIFTIFGLVTMRPTGNSLVRIAGLVGFVILAGILFVLAFPDMLAAMEVRFERAERAEGSIIARAFSGLTEPSKAYATAPFFGHGMGAGAAGVARFIGVPPLAYGESDLQRNVNELGIILGTVMLILRATTAGWIALVALRLARRDVVIALPLAGFVLAPLVMGQVTHSPISGYNVWLFIGLVSALYFSSTQNRE